MDILEWLYLFTLEQFQTRQTLGLKPLMRVLEGKVSLLFHLLRAVVSSYNRALQGLRYRHPQISYMKQHRLKMDFA